jgi:hypothetical protein
MNCLRCLGTAAPLIIALLTGSAAEAASYGFTFTDGAISGDLTFTVGSAPLAGDPATSLPITDISGTITDTAFGYIDIPVESLIAISPTTGDPLAPHSFSLDLTYGHSYDNLYYADGQSTVVCSDYPFSGGYLDIYGVAFTLKNGAFVNVWSNGVLPGGTAPSYGAYVTPEPSTWAMLVFGFAAVGLVGYRGSRKSAVAA